MNRLGLALSMLALVAFAFAQPASAALRSIVTDPVGDTFFNSAPAYQDIVGAMVALKGERFIFVMDLAGPVPASPTLPPQGQDHIVWVFDLDSDPATAPSGFPFAPGSPHAFEFFAVVIWDGTAFSANLFDRRPLLAGMPAIVVPVRFNIDGSELTTFVDAALVGNPSTFGWAAVTVDWATPFGTDGFNPVDRAPDAILATWPS